MGSSGIVWVTTLAWVWAPVSVTAARFSRNAYSEGEKSPLSGRQTTWNQVPAGAFAATSAAARSSAWSRSAP